MRTLLWIGCSEPPGFARQERATAYRHPPADTTQTTGGIPRCRDSSVSIADQPDAQSGGPGGPAARTAARLQPGRPTTPFRPRRSRPTSNYGLGRGGRGRRWPQGREVGSPSGEEMKPGRRPRGRRGRPRQRGRGPPRPPGAVATPEYRPRASDCGPRRRPRRGGPVGEKDLGEAVPVLAPTSMARRPATRRPSVANAVSAVRPRPTTVCPAVCRTLTPRIWSPPRPPGHDPPVHNSTCVPDRSVAADLCARPGQSPPNEIGVQPGPSPGLVPRSASLAAGRAVEVFAGRSRQHPGRRRTLPGEGGANAASITRSPVVPLALGRPSGGSPVSPRVVPACLADSVVVCAPGP